MILSKATMRSCTSKTHGYIYMHVGIIEFLNLNAQHLNIYQICKNKGYAPGLALGRRKVRGVSRGRLLELLRYKDFLLILLDDLLEVLLKFIKVWLKTKLQKHF
jgi:hypothetical protein